MAELIPFPLQRRADLVRSIVDDLERVHGEAANEFWRSRIAAIVSDLRLKGLPDETVRAEIYELRDAVQLELRQRAPMQAER